VVVAVGCCVVRVRLWVRVRAWRDVGLGAQGSSFLGRGHVRCSRPGASWGRHSTLQQVVGGADLSRTFHSQRVTATIAHGKERQ
jgi:hypothetical protein